jgi:diguanylate cyclase (GGDEF)-like protein/PAS domain S-box-containing protein
MMNNLPGMAFQFLNDPPQRTFVFASEGCLPLAGYSQDELIGSGGLNFFSLAHPDDAERLEEEAAETLSMGLPLETTFRIITKGGATKWVWERSRVVELNPDGTPFLFEGFLTDVTEQRKNQQEAKEADERVRLMFNSMPFGCIYWNDKAAPIDCNDEALRLFGVSNKQELIDNFFEFSPKLQPDGSSSTEKAYSHIFYAFRHGKVVFEWMHQKRNGDPFPTEITIIKAARGSEQIAVSYMRDLSEIKKKSAELNSAKELAFTDSLTGIPNRRFFMEHALNEFSAQENIAAAMGIIMFDIDHFKHINDTFGHDCGDEALKMVVAHAQSALRESDVMARLGGEEFIVLVHHLELNNLVRLAERMLKSIENMEFIYNGERIPITVSAGIAIRENILQPHTHVIKQADVALYRAKTNGRNRVEVLDE